uniref:Uncharacterized protein n=1 Tax=Chrysemys picta bellii TaxID=8478 RepID=A0A8C3FQK1_CHRPI
MEESNFSPQGREEAGSLIVLHYNPTGKLILGEKNLMVLVALWKNNKFLTLSTPELWAAAAAVCIVAVPRNRSRGPAPHCTNTDQRRSLPS